MNGRIEDSGEYEPAITAIRSDLERLLERADSCSQGMLAIKIDEALNIARMLEAELKTT